MFAKGLRYGGACAAVMFVVLAGVILANGADWSTVIFGGGIDAITFGVIGFAIGCASYRRPPSDPLDVRVDSAPSAFKRWGYRFLAGLLIGYLAASLVIVVFIGGFIFLYGSFAEFEKLPRDRVQPDIVVLALMTMCGAEVSAMVGGFLGAMLAPLRCEGRAVMKCSFISAGFAMLAGAGASAAVWLLRLNHFAENQGMILTIIIGVVAGAGAAMIPRMRNFQIKEKSGFNDPKDGRIVEDAVPAAVERNEASEAIQSDEHRIKK